MGLVTSLSGCGGGGTSTPVEPPVPTRQPAADRPDLAYTTVPRQLALDLYTPAGTPPFPVVVWIHGGSWVSGVRDIFPGHPALRLRDRGYAVATIDYRLVPEGFFPAQARDCKAALRWLRGNADRYGLDRRIAAWGASAGGHLAALLGTSGGMAVLENPAQGHAGESSRVQAVVDWFGPTDYRLGHAKNRLRIRQQSSGATPRCPPCGSAPRAASELERSRLQLDIRPLSGRCLLGKLVLLARTGRLGQRLASAHRAG
jgi:hypothetical protein